MTQIAANPFREIPASNATAATLREEIASHGYVLVCGWLPRADLKVLLSDITRLVSGAGWLLSGNNPLDRVANPDAACGDPELAYRTVFKEIFALESLHAFAHRSAMRRLMQLVAGDNLFIHPKPIARVIFPNCDRFTTVAHQDNRAIGGDPESFTAWTPLHDCPPELGPLKILAASHLYGLQTESASERLRPDAVRGEGWVSGTIRAGDVLIFHSLAVHAGTQNVSRQLRISVDWRFQDAARAVDPAALVFPGSSSDRRTWADTYADWKFPDLKFYWQKIPLELRPSAGELTRLAESAEPSEMRERYARILVQIEQQGLA